MLSRRRIPFFDGHNDVLLRLWRSGEPDTVKAFLEGDTESQLDFPKARQGGFAGGLFAIFVPSARRRDEDKTGSGEKEISESSAIAPPGITLTRAQIAVFAMSALLFRMERESKGALRVCRDVEEIAQCLDARVLAAVLHIEGAEAIDENFEVLEVLHAAGLRSLGPVWSRPNAFGYGVPFRSPASPDTGPGLTDLGKALIRACNELKILIDLSHLNEQGFWDVAAISDAPLVATHSNAHEVSPHSRNLTDRQLAAIRDSQGLVGVTFATNYLRSESGRNADTTADLILKHVDHVLKHVGEDGIGFGSDFDGAKMPVGLESAAEMQTVVRLLRSHGFGERLIEKLCFKNWLKVLRRTWGPASSRHREHRPTRKHSDAIKGARGEADRIVSLRSSREHTPPRSRKRPGPSTTM
jgi:membrane dipeptidase